jgi:uncharacterized protein (TIGR02271 family)
MNTSPNDSGTLDAGTAKADRETVIPVFEEELSVAKRVVETARVQVSRVTHSHQQMVDELLQHEKVEVERVPIDRPIEAMPSIRQEGEVTIIPVVEEVLKVERRLVLKEEVHIRRIKQTERHQELVTLRRQEALVSRTPIEQPVVLTTGLNSKFRQPRKEQPMSTYEKIVTLFDTAEHAQAAKTNLQHAGYSSEDISIVSGQELPRSASALREPGLWHRLFGGDIEEHEATVYAKAVESGGVVLALRAKEEEIPKAMGILNQHNLVDVKDRAVDTGIISKVAAATIAAPAAVAAAVPARPVISDLGKNEVIRLAEEHLEVGKRLVEQGTTRIRRFVTEKPVEAQVTLHEEHAEVVRRAVSDPNYVKDIDWSDSTIEVLETSEEAVVSKSARIAEEVVVGKTGSDRVETVRDTVRRQQVEVERVPGARPKE